MKSKLLAIIAIAVLSAPLSNAAFAEITEISKGISGGKYGGILVGSENLMTLCVEGYVVLYVSEPNTGGIAFQLLDSDSKPLGCPDPDPLGLFDKTE